MRLQKMLSTVVALLLFVGGASAHEGSDQLTGEGASWVGTWASHMNGRSTARPSEARQPYCYSVSLSLASKVQGCVLRVYMLSSAAASPVMQPTLSTCCTSVMFLCLHRHAKRAAWGRSKPVLRGGGCLGILSVAQTQDLQQQKCSAANQR